MARGDLGSGIQDVMGATGARLGKGPVDHRIAVVGKGPPFGGGLTVQAKPGPAGYPKGPLGLATKSGCRRKPCRSLRGGWPLA